MKHKPQTLQMHCLTCTDKPLSTAVILQICSECTGPGTPHIAWIDCQRCLLNSSHTLRNTEMSSRMDNSKLAVFCSVSIKKPPKRLSHTPWNKGSLGRLVCVQHCKQHRASGNFTAAATALAAAAAVVHEIFARLRAETTKHWANSRQQQRAAAAVLVLESFAGLCAETTQSTGRIHDSNSSQLLQ